MVPYGREFARIDIPVLSITGYYDDAQISVLQYFNQHYAHRRNAEQYLVVGPYDHFGSNAHGKPAVLRDYPIDTSAQLDTEELKLAFMDHVLRGAPLPALLADRVNYEVMGMNEWRHVHSLADMHPASKRVFFSPAKIGEHYSLAATPPAGSAVVTHTVDLANRNLFHNFHSYPGQIIQGPLRYVTEAVFESAPFETSTTLSGQFRGELAVSINKRDFDYGVTVFEAMPDGKLFHLGYSLNRASYAHDPTRRTLLEPGRTARLPFETSLVSRRMQAGSRLLVLVDANKTPFAQVNYGTGKDVSDESVRDAGTPLEIRIRAGSYVDLPLDR